MTPPKLTQYEPGLYQITVQGMLQDDWSDYAPGVCLSTEVGGQGAVTMVLVQVEDQAALSGVLARLYALGLPLLSVGYLGRQQTPGGDSASTPP